MASYARRDFGSPAQNHSLRTISISSMRFEKYIVVLLVLGRFFLGDPVGRVLQVNTKTAGVSDMRSGFFRRPVAAGTLQRGKTNPAGAHVLAGQSRRLNSEEFHSSDTAVTAIPPVAAFFLLILCGSNPES